MNTCCGQKPRVRLIDGQLITQPHRCQDRDKEPDWVEFQGEQARKLVPEVPVETDIEYEAAELMRRGLSIEVAFDRARAHQRALISEDSGA